MLLIKYYKGFIINLLFILCKGNYVVDDVENRHNSGYNLLNNTNSLNEINNILNFNFVVNQSETNLINVSSNNNPRNLAIANSTNFVFICNSNSSCSDQGFCLNSTHCQCNQNYITILNNTNLIELKQCNYLGLNKIELFLLSFFLGPISADQFYLGNIMLGFLKLLIPTILFVTGFGLAMIGKKKKNEYYQVYGKVIEFVSTFIIFVWWICDIIIITSTDNYTDINDFPLL